MEQIRQTYDVVPWSPLHIDAGVTVRKHSFRLHCGQLIRYDEEILLEEIADDESLLNRFIAEGVVPRLVRALLIADLGAWQKSHFGMFRRLRGWLMVCVGIS